MVERSVMADATKATVRLSVTSPIPRPPAVREKFFFFFACDYLFGAYKILSVCQFDL